MKKTKELKKIKEKNQKERNTKKCQKKISRQSLSV